MNKKTIYIIIGVIVTFFVATIILILITTNPVNISSNPDGDKISMSFMPPNSKVIFYYDGNSTIKKWDLTNNRVESWIKLPTSNFDNINYSPDGSLALVYWSDSNYHEHAWLVDLKNQKIIKEIGQNIISNAWSTDGQKIVYQYSDTGANKYELILASPDDSDPKFIANLSPTFGAGDIAKILWPDDQNIMFFPVKQEMLPVNIETINLDTLKRTTVLSQVFPNDAYVALNQDKALIDFTDQNSNVTTTSIYDFSNQQTKTINENNLFLDKTSQIGNTNNFYAGWRAAGQNTDNIIRFDTNGKIDMIRKLLPDNLSIANLMSPDSHDLYFINIYDNKLYHLKINL
jgi:hypothetical protein